MGARGMDLTGSGQGPVLMSTVIYIQDS
jgi:hypothetical protein